MWQGRTLSLDHVGPNWWRKKKEKEKKKEKKEAPTSLYNIRRSMGRFSSGQELKIICSTKATRGYRKHEISLRIQLKSLGNQGFRV